MNTAEYLNRLFGATTGGLGLSWLPETDGKLLSSYCPDADALLRRLAEMNGHTAGVYVRMTTLSGPPPARKRGGAELSHELPALWADIDFGTVGHRHTPDKHRGLVLPPDEEAARSIVELAGLPEPTIEIHSGGGLYPLWLLTDPWVLTDAEERAEAATLSERWNKQLAAGAAAADLYYGSDVHDLTRVLRLPGTVNRKVADNPRECRVLSDDGPTYTVEQLLSALDDAEMTHGVELPSTGSARASTRYTAEERAQFDFREAVEPAVEDRLAAGPGIRGVLLSAGWSECDCDRGDCVEHFTRPGGGSTTSHSAHTIPENPHVLVVHSAETGLPAGEGQRLTASRLYALLYHDGDETAAHRALVRSEHDDGGVLAPYGWGNTDAITTLFNATPTFQHIRAAARSRMLSETGVLLNLLGLRAMTIPVERKIPAVVGSRANLNLVLGTVGESGSGKSTSHEVALELLGQDQPDTIRSLGTGQGIAEQYMGEILNDEGKRVRGAVHGAARFFLEDEVDAITSKGENASDAALGEIRKAYTGSHIGQSNATAERNRNIPSGTYRFVLLTNIQPGRSQGLFTEKQIHAGTPQRFALLPASTLSDDEWERLTENDELPEFPGPLDLPVNDFADGDFEIPNDIAREIRRTFARRNSEEGALRSHRQLTKLKVAAVLADLHGETAITTRWWELAEIVMMISDGQVELCRSRIAVIRAEENKSVGTAMAHQQFEMTRTRGELEDSELDEIRRTVVEVLEGNGDTAKAEFRPRLSTGKRRRLNEALDSLVEDDLISIKTVKTSGRPREIYYLTEREEQS